MEEVHAIVGKTRCMQLTMFVTGFEGMIFNALAQFGLFPCEPPLNFYSRRQGESICDIYEMVLFTNCLKKNGIKTFFNKAFRILSIAVFYPKSAKTVMGFKS